MIRRRRNVDAIEVLPTIWPRCLDFRLGPLLSTPLIKLRFKLLQNFFRHLP